MRTRFCLKPGPSDRTLIRTNQRAGNSPEKIIEIHGTAFSVSCLSCAHKYDRAALVIHDSVTYAMAQMVGI